MATVKEITIISVLNGYRVKVGCQEVVFDSRKKMLKELNRYLKNPQEVEDEYMGEKSSYTRILSGSLSFNPTDVQSITYATDNTRSTADYQSS